MTAKDLCVVIPSSGRPKSARAAFRLVEPFAHVCVSEKEKSSYAAFGKALVTHPDNITGTGALWRWILERYKQRSVVILDDSVYRVLCLVGRRARLIAEPAAVQRILLNSAIVAEATGASLFSYAASSNIVHFLPYDPISLATANGPCIGIIGRKILPDPALAHGVDVDLALQALLKDRIVWQDRRFRFDLPEGGHTGPPLHSTAKTVGDGRDRPWDRDRRYLKQKWGPYARESNSSGIPHMTIANVSRRQKLAFNEDGKIA